MRFALRSATSAIGIAALAAAAVIPTARAQEAAKLVAGTLTCKGQGSVGMIVGSKQNLACTFTPANKSVRPHSYTATITKIGLDVGVKGPSTMIWTVLYSTSTVPSGALAGNYAGVSADASIGVGAGANVLVGGSKNSVTLQPLSVQGQTGVNLAVGISGLKLR